MAKEKITYHQLEQSSIAFISKVAALLIAGVALILASESEVINIQNIIGFSLTIVSTLLVIYYYCQNTPKKYYNNIIITLNRMINDSRARTIISKPVKVELPLKKPDLSGKSKWEFIYTKKIEASINDDIFLDKVRKGKIKNLYAGVRVPCKLQFEYDLDENHDIVPNSDKYTILEITGDIIEPEQDNQPSLFN